MSIGNYPETSIEVERVWTDGNEKHDADNITVTLQQKIGSGDWSDTIRLADLGETYTWSDTESVTATLSKENDWSCKFTDLPVMVPSGDDFKGKYTAAEYRILETEMNGKVPAQNVDVAKYKETTYDVTEADGDSPMKVTITYDLDDMKNDDGSYAKKKVFRYVIEERIPDSADEKGYDSDSDIQYDTGKKYVTVTLTLSGSELKASVKYDGGKVPEFTNTKKPKNPPPTPSVKTGDHSGILLYVILMLAAIGALAAVLGFRRKKNMQ